MASKNEWKEDDQLEQDLKTYISQNLKRSEVLDFMQRDFPQYTWSLPTLDRRLRHFFTSLFFLHKLRHSNCSSVRCGTKRIGQTGSATRLQSNESEAQNRAQRNPGNFCLWNPESLASESGIPLEESRIPLTTGIRNPRSTEKYLESSTQNPESTGCNPESSTVLVGDTF